ncbi:MAG TPA: hypothetical protein VGG72_12045 [Bryobacteraceae bacterium]|jgi:hypothetical protein
MRLLLACCCASALRAQAPAEIDPGQQVVLAERTASELARQWINDPRPLYKAWAAEIIRQHEWQPSFRAELIAALGDLSHLEASSGVIGTDEDRMRMVILDALIQGRVRVARNISEALLIRYPAQVVGRLVEKNALLEAIRRHVEL